MGCKYKVRIPIWNCQRKLNYPCTVMQSVGRLWAWVRNCKAEWNRVWSGWCHLRTIDGRLCSLLIALSKNSCFEMATSIEPVFSLCFGTHSTTTPDVSLPLPVYVRSGLLRFFLIILFILEDLNSLSLDYDIFKMPSQVSLKKQLDGSYTSMSRNSYWPTMRWNRMEKNCGAYPA